MSVERYSCLSFPTVLASRVKNTLTKIKGKFFFDNIYNQNTKKFKL